MKLRLVLFAVMALGGCARVDTAWNTLTSAKISTKDVYVFENAYVALEQTATNYIRLPPCGKTTVKLCSNDEAVARIIPAVRSLRAANDALVSVQKTHPDQLQASGVYDTAKASYSTLLTILSIYGVSK